MTRDAHQDDATGYNPEGVDIRLMAWYFGSADWSNEPAADSASGGATVAKRIGTTAERATAPAVGFKSGARPELDNETREFSDTVRCIVLLVPTADVGDLDIPESAVALVNKALNLDNPKANDELLRTGGVKGSYSILHGSMADAEEGITLTTIIDGTPVDAPMTLNLNLSVQGRQVPASVKAATMAANVARREALKVKDEASHR